MESAAGSTNVIAVAPAAPLRQFISHYWLSRDNRDATCTILPDGAVDVVLQVSGGDVQARVYGTSTKQTDTALEQRCDYLGIRFKPGQCRHFVNAAASELTDCNENADGLLRFAFDDVSEALGRDEVFSCVDQSLHRYLSSHPPSHARIDDVIAAIEVTHGAMRIDQLALSFGISRRQLERVFLQTVGVSAKLFSRIMRLHQALELIGAHSGVSLASTAAECGYTDQSHMNHDFKCLAGVSPQRFLRSDVAFLQDRQRWIVDTDIFLNSIEG
jgi:AraC-like DNA-binding protein